MRLSTVATAVAALGCLAACSREDPAVRDASIARSAIITQIGAGAKAMRDKNVDGYLDQIPDEIEIRDPSGEIISRDSLRAQVLRSWETIQRTLHLEVKADSMITFPDSAIVFTTTRWDRLVVQPGAKAVDTVASLKIQRESWRRTPKGWRSFSVAPLGGTTMVNGKVFVDG